MTVADRTARDLSRDELFDLIFRAWHDTPTRAPRVRLNIRPDGGFSVDAQMRLNWEAPPIRRPTARVDDLTIHALRMIAHHEREHLTVSPRTWDNHARMLVQLAKAGIADAIDTDQQTWGALGLIVNIYVDLQVNDGLGKRFGAAWLDALRTTWDFWASDDPLQAVFRRAEDHLHKSNIAPVADPAVDADAKQLAMFARSGMLIPAARIIEKYLAQSIEQARQRQGDGKARGGGQPGSGAGPDGLTDNQRGGGVTTVRRDLQGSDQPRNDTEAKERLARIADEEDADAKDTARAGRGAGLGMTEVEADELIVEARVLRLYRRALVKIDPRAIGRESMSIRIPERWQVGDPVDRLDIARTLRTRGRVIPNVTTIKRSAFHVDRPVERGVGARLAIAMDESGSIGADLWVRVLEAAIGLATLAADRRWEILPMKFADGVAVYPGGWTREHIAAMRWMSRRRVSGGTTLTTTLRAVDAAGPDNATIAVITDTDIFDLTRIAPQVQAMAARGAAFRFFMLGKASVPASLSDAFGAEYDVKFFAIPDPSRTLTDDVITEVDRHWKRGDHP